MVRIKNVKYLSFSFILLLFTLNSHANSGIYFYDGFEYSDDLEDRNYVVNKDSDPNMIAEPNRFAASTGERGLLMKSDITAESVDITILLNIGYVNDLFFSLHIKLISNGATIRLELKDGNDVLSLDYGQNWSRWESETIYDIQEPFLQNQWKIVNRKISEDVVESLNNENSVYTDFTPDTISSISIIQDNIEGINELHLDEIEISGPEVNSQSSGDPNLSQISAPNLMFFALMLLVINRGINRRTRLLD